MEEEEEESLLNISAIHFEESEDEISEIHPDPDDNDVSLLQMFTQCSAGIDNSDLNLSQASIEYASQYFDKVQRFSQLIKQRNSSSPASLLHEFCLQQSQSQLERVSAAAEKDTATESDSDDNDDILLKAFGPDYGKNKKINLELSLSSTSEHSDDETHLPENIIKPDVKTPTSSPSKTATAAVPNRSCQDSDDEGSSGSTFFSFSLENINPNTGHLNLFSNRYLATPKPTACVTPLPKKERIPFRRALSNTNRIKKKKQEVIQPKLVQQLITKYFTQRKKMRHRARKIKDLKSKMAENLEHDKINLDESLNFDEPFENNLISDRIVQNISEKLWKTIKKPRESNSEKTTAQESQRNSVKASVMDQLRPNVKVCGCLCFCEEGTVVDNTDGLLENSNSNRLSQISFTSEYPRPFSFENNFELFGLHTL